MLRANTQIYELHSSADGEVICVAETLSPGERVALTNGNSAQATADLARAHLSSRLGIPRDEIRVNGLQPVEWSDLALECKTTGSTPTPTRRLKIAGYRILLNTAENLHEYHSGGLWLVYCGSAATQ
jgi:hypothetical protein